MTYDELTADTRAAVDVSDVAPDILPLDPRTIYRGLEDGTIPGIKIGRRWLVLRVPFLRMLTGETSEPEVTAA